MSGFSVRALALSVFLLSAAAADAHSFYRQAPELIRAPQQRYLISLGNARPQKVRDVARYFARQGLDVAGVNFKRRQVELIITAADAAELEKRFDIHAQSLLQENVAPLDQRYLNPEKLEAKLKELARQYPTLAKLHEIGKSTQGRPIFAMEISSPSPRVKPNFLFDGNHHAREIMTPEVVVDIAETLLKAANSPRSFVREQADDLLEQARIWVLPMLNPDGNNIVWTQDTWWRKNAFAEGGKVQGVDINRNYTFQWGACNGSSSDANSDTYRGPKAGSEPEIQAIMHLGDLIRPVGSISFHSFGEMVLEPYGCDGEYSPERTLLEGIGQKMAKSLPTDNGNFTYEFGPSWQILYPVDGGAKDYFYAAYGSVAYTVEMNEDFQPDYSVREPTLIKMRVAWLGFIRDLLANMVTVRVTDANDKPVPAEIEFAEVAHKLGERPFTTNELGVLHKALAPGKYHVRVKRAGSSPQELELNMDGSPQVLEVKF